MTKSEYVVLLKQAKEDSIEERWIPLRDSAHYTNVPGCPFCELAWKTREPSSYPCYYCPLTTMCVRRDYSQVYSDMCCDGFWKEWRETYSAEIAQRIIYLINAVDVVAWAETLIERGVLENDQI